MAKKKQPEGRVTSESIMKEHKDLMRIIEDKHNKAVDNQDYQGIYYLAVTLNLLSSWLFSSLGPGSDPTKGRKINMSDLVKSEPWGQA